jgi:aminoglycoside phosphotransferase (APT) family kinase protein
MHTDELDVSVQLVQELVNTQFPQWRTQPIVRLASWGTENAMYRLGDGLVVRLPRRAGSVRGLEKELRWLPVLAPRLPIAVPEPVAFGMPTEDYPFPWAVYRWLAGIPALDADVDRQRLAADLAAFIKALQRAEVPSPQILGSRGVPLAERDAAVRAQLPKLAGDVDVAAVTRVWEHALAAPVWNGPPVWLHGDLMPTNLLIEQGVLVGVVDFGTCANGDPACDALAAWMSLTEEARVTFRRLLDLDDATWARARGWALSCAAIALPYYRDTYPSFAGLSRRTLAEVLGDDLE